MGVTAKNDLGKFVNGTESPEHDILVYYNFEIGYRDESFKSVKEK